MHEKLFARLQEIYPELVQFRRDLHMYPELSFHEEKTAKKVADKLSSLGIAQERPATFFNIGGRNPDIEATYPHHHPKFDVDERSMIQTGQVFIAALLAYQRRHQQ